MTIRAHSRESRRVITVKPDRPYFDAWLRRTNRRFAASGRLSQAAIVLAGENGGTADDWRARLRLILDGKEVPSLDLLTRIDSLFTVTSSLGVEKSDTQGSLFP